ncbi:hypothetical protein ACQPW3_32275 [Actinosynnema sp. CA-248983]
MTPHFVVAPLTTEHALSITTWRYADEWSVYDSRPEEGLYEAEEGYAAVLDATSGGPPWSTWSCTPTCVR